MLSEYLTSLKRGFCTCYKRWRGYVHWGLLTPHPKLCWACAINYLGKWRRFHHATKSTGMVSTFGPRVNWKDFVREMVTDKSTQQGGISYVSSFPFLFRSLLAPLVLSVPFALCAFIQDSIPRDCTHWGGREGNAGMSTLPLPAQAIARPYQSGRGEVEKRHLGKQNEKNDEERDQSKQKGVKPKKGNRLGWMRKNPYGQRQSMWNSEPGSGQRPLQSAVTLPASWALWRCRPLPCFRSVILLS